MKKVLWLCSWYPHSKEPFEGDFVQRHAQAVALYNNLSVIYVSQNVGSNQSDEDSYERKSFPGLTENLIIPSFRKSGFLLLDKVRFHFKYIKIFKKEIKSYIVQHGIPDIVHVHIPVKSGILAIWMKRKWRTKYFLTEHSSHYDYESEDSFFKKNYFHRKLTASIYSKSSIVTTVSRSVASVISNAFKLKSVEVIPNAVDTQFFYFLPSGKFKKFRFIHVSSMNEKQKNVAGILKAISLLRNERRDFELLVVGRANEELYRLCDTIDIKDSVIFAGEVSYESVAKYMQSANALVLFSRHENLPCVILEAFCCGLPVITTNVGGIAEVINEKNGILIQSEDIDGLKNAMFEIVDNYSVYNRQLISNKAKEKFSLSSVGEEFITLYEFLLNR